MPITTVQAPPAGIFKGIKDAKLARDFVYVTAGRYWCRIDTLKIGADRNGVPFKANEFTVVRVLEAIPGKSHSIGDEITDYTKAGDYLKKDVAKMICGFMGLEPEQLSDEQALQVYGPDQPFRGYVVEVRAREATSDSGGTFTRISYLRRVPAAEIQAELSADEIKRFFPNDALKMMAEADKAG